MPRVHRRTSSLRRSRKRLVGLLCSALLATGTVVLGTVATAPSASAHGNVSNPIARGWRCLQLYGDIWYQTTYQATDPMCWSAFQTSSNAMWNWNGMFMDGLNGNYEAVADICSAGNATYGVLSVPGDWKATTMPTSFPLVLNDQASHGADWIRVYISKDGFDVTTDQLGWDDVTQIASIGQIPTTGNGTVNADVGGSTYTLPVDASGYPGRRVLFTLWKASHADQTYFLCSDVNIGGGSGTTTTTTTRPTTTTTTTTTTTRPTTTTTTTTRPTTTTTTTSRPTTTTMTTTTTTRPTTTTTTTTSRPTTTTTTSGGSTGVCSATYTVTSQWSGGFTADVKVTAGSSAISGWTVHWTFANGETINSMWNASPTQSGSAVSAKNMAYNSALAAGASTTFGFLGGGGSPAAPTGVSCTSP